MKQIRDVGKQLRVWLASLFYEINSDSTGNENGLWPQELNHCYKHIIFFVNKTKS